MKHYLCNFLIANHSVAVFRWKKKGFQKAFISYCIIESVLVVIQEAYSI